MPALTHHLQSATLYCYPRPPISIVGRLFELFGFLITVCILFLVVMVAYDFFTSKEFLEKHIVKRAPRWADDDDIERNGLFSSPAPEWWAIPSVIGQRIPTIWGSNSKSDQGFPRIGDLIIALTTDSAGTQVWEDQRFRVYGLNCDGGDAPLFVCVRDEDGAQEYLSVADMRRHANVTRTWVLIR